MPEPTGPNSPNGKSAAAPSVRYITTDFFFSYTCPEDYSALLAAVAKDRNRNAQVVGWVAQETREGNVCLVVSGRIEHCHELANALNDEGVAAAAMTSKTKPAARTHLLNHARTGELSVLVATNLSGVELDHLQVSRVFLVFPGCVRGRTVQVLSQLMRPHPDKPQVILYDFIDRKVPALRRQQLQHKQLHRAISASAASEAQPKEAARGSKCDA